LCETPGRDWHSIVSKKSKGYFMNSRSKKYYESRKAQSGSKKGSATEAGYNEQNEKTSKEKGNSAPSKNQDHPKEDSRAAQKADIISNNP
jgi:hypothetical protein